MALRVVDAVVSIVSRLVLGAWARLPLRLRPERRTARSRGMYAHGGNAKNPAGVASEIRLVTFGDFFKCPLPKTHTHTHSKSKKTSLSHFSPTNSAPSRERRAFVIDSRDARCADRSNKLFPATLCRRRARAGGAGGKIGKAGQSADKQPTKQLTDNKRFFVCG